MSSALSTFASATPFAKELSLPPKQPYALSSAAADKTHALYSAANVPGSRAIQRGDSQNQSRYTARRTYQAHALYSAATAKPIALYSAVNARGSRAVQRGDGKAKRTIQRGERTRLTRDPARRRQSQTRYTARRTHQAHALFSAGTSIRRRRH